ncbi:MAG: mechanosensitive ion channel [Bacteroidetes bacterium]|jgi:small-conductance mechanosensitive channel|nr:mechanosensitive ion channel [Bacteroidota bacterium]
MMDSVIDFVASYELTFKVIFILVGTVILANIVSRIYKKLVERSVDNDDHLTTYRFLGNSIATVIYVIGFSFAIWNIPFLKPVAQSVVAGAGILAIAVGFASQQSLGNIISGFFIVLSKPYKINDRITFSDGLVGVVEDIGLRHTVIRNFENQRIIIPNSIISNERLVNAHYEEPKVCRFVDVGISYDSDIDLAKKIMAEVIENHELSIDNRTTEEKKKKEPIVSVRVIMLAESSVNLRAWAWAENAADGYELFTDVIESIKKRFDREGINIPFPQRTLSYLDQKNEKDFSPN